MKIENKLDRLMSIYIRLRDAKDGGNCISCGKPIRFDDCDAGHYIKREVKILRWNPHNVNAQCKTCNQFRRGNTKDYRERLIKKIGLESVKDLERKKNKLVKFAEIDLIEIGEELEQKIKELQ